MKGVGNVKISFLDGKIIIEPVANEELVAHVASNGDIVICKK